MQKVFLNGDIQIGSLKFNNMVFNKASIEVNGEAGSINLKPIHFDFYQGKGNGAINLDIGVRIAAGSRVFI